jgi:outer membrane protein assembly factor BamB
MLKKRKAENSDSPAQPKPVRMLPGIVIVIIQWLLRFGLPKLGSDMIVASIALIVGVVGGLAVIVWWAFFSRAPRSERWGAVALIIIAFVGIFFLLHESISTGFQGMMFFFYSVPVLSLAFVIWALVSRRLSKKLRWVTMALVILLSCGVWTLLRSEGITGNAAAEFKWRWAETSEEKLLAQLEDEPMSIPSITDAAGIGGSWSGFRGAERDSIIQGVKIETDWSASPPEELWRRPIGPGCSSFAVCGILLYTQEQRGDDEVVSCYDLTNGKPVWRHRNAARFWDSHAGAGPRSTPTLSGDRVYTLGATGILNVLEAKDGSVVWSRNAASDVEVELPGWAFTSSPLVVDNVVIVAFAGTLAAYDIATGEPHWFGPDGGGGYSSPHLLTIDGIKQVLLMSEVGATSLNPADGKVLWMHSWPKERILQPALIADGELLLNGGELAGMCRISVVHGSDGWTTEERWSSSKLKPYFNDFVVHKGHVYCFNGPRLGCVDLKDGSRKWAGGRYGGQLLLLADQDLLIVLTEKGELALVKAVPDQRTELARFSAIKGKTWNHPVLAGDILVVRNSREMAAFRLSLTGE